MDISTPFELERLQALEDARDAAFTAYLDANNAWAKANLEYEWNRRMAPLEAKMREIMSGVSSQFVPGLPVKQAVLGKNHDTRA